MSLSSAGLLTVADDIVIGDGKTIGVSSTTDAITIASNGNVTLSGDLTISGDDLVMATNTSGNLLIADGTNYNPTAVGDLSEISTVANDDVLLAVDTSGGGTADVSDDNETTTVETDTISAEGRISSSEQNKAGKYAEAVASETTYESGEGNATIIPVPTGGGSGGGVGNRTNRRVSGMKTRVLIVDYTELALYGGK